MTSRPMNTAYRAAALCAALFALTATAGAQEPNRPDSAQTARVVGTVVDSDSRQPVTGARVSLIGLIGGSASRSAITDLRGQYAFRNVVAGTYTIEVRRIGYEPMTRTGVRVAAGAPATVPLSLTALAFRLADVTVAPGAYSLLGTTPSVRQSLSRETIETAPFGEDLFRAMNRLPGLTSGDYGAQFSIRGGRRDETLILLDGLELYEPFHLKDFNEGALSIVNVETIDGVELLTGGFPAQYGDKRSGVMNITARTPRVDGTHVSASVSLTSANALAEGTFARTRGAWLVSGRRGFVDLLFRLINKAETKAPSYDDVFGTLRFALHPHHSLAFNVLQASDRYRFTIKGTTGFGDSIPTIEAADNSYGNAYAWLTMRSLIGSHLTARSLVSTGSVTASREGNEHHATIPLEFYGVRNSRNFTVSSVRQDYTYQGSDRLIINWGFDARWLRARYNTENRITQNPDSPIADTSGFYPRVTRSARNTNGTTLAGYVSNRWQLLPRLTVESGVRYDAATYSHDRDVSPRVNAMLRLGARTTLRTGWGEYRQRQGIADENAFDKLNQYFRSEKSAQWTIGVAHEGLHGESWRAEAYRKSGSRLRPILRNWKAGLNVFPESAEDRILVYPEATTSTGLELSYERSLGQRIDLRANYALSKVDERVSRIDNINDRKKLLFSATHSAPQDQRHALNADVTYRPAELWSITSALTFHTGWPITEEIGTPVRLRNGTMDLSIGPDSLYGGRLPAYQRLDVRVTRRKRTATGEFRFFVEAINLTNHENVLGYDVRRIRDASGAPVLQRTVEAWFSILPSLGVSWSRKF